MNQWLVWFSFVNKKIPWFIYKADQFSSTETGRIHILLENRSLFSRADGIPVAFLSFFPQDPYYRSSVCNILLVLPHTKGSINDRRQTTHVVFVELLGHPLPSMAGLPVLSTMFDRSYQVVYTFPRKLSTCLDKQLKLYKRLCFIKPFLPDRSNNLFDKIPLWYELNKSGI